MLKILVYLSLIISLKASDYQEFKELCSEVRVSSSISVSKYKNLEDSIEAGKIKILKSLSEEFTGVLVESKFIVKKYSNKDGYKKEIISYLKTQSNGWLFPKYLYIYDNKTSYFKFDKINDLLTINAKLKCNKRVYRALNSKISNLDNR